MTFVYVACTRLAGVVCNPRACVELRVRCAGVPWVFGGGTFGVVLIQRGHAPLPLLHLLLERVDEAVRKGPGDDTGNQG